jgi:hypothetical protein
MTRTWLVALAFLVAACEYNFNMGAPSSTNTNTNTVNIDIHDLVNFVPVANPTLPVPGPNGPETPAPLPTNAEAIARSVATANATAIAQSCQATFGASAWAFMDAVVTALRASDTRWGYVVKTGGQVSQDVIGYRATSDNIGAWGIDIIVGHCGASPSFGWQVLGFDTNLQWAATRNGS